MQAGTSLIVLDMTGNGLTWVTSPGAALWHPGKDQRVPPLQIQQEFSIDLFASEITPEASEGEDLNQPHRHQVGKKQRQATPHPGKMSNGD